MIEPGLIAEQYLTGWNVTPTERSNALVNWSEDATYIDPLMSAEGRDAIAAMIDKATAQFPGYRFALEGTPDGHGNYVRFTWNLAAPSGEVAARGTDIVRVDGGGRIAEVIGFLEVGAS